MWWEEDNDANHREYRVCIDLESIMMCNFCRRLLSDITLNELVKPELGQASADSLSLRLRTY